MAKEWILNMATNRWGLNKKDSVGPVSLWIRECDPKTINDWQSFYYKKLVEMLKQKGINLSPQEYIQDLGRKLHTKITEVIQAEIEEVTEEDCLQYIYNLVINRTFDGYQTEIKTIYGKLQRDLGIIFPSKDFKRCVFNVPIRTVIINKNRGEMGVGGGVVISSKALSEYEECKLKANFLIKRHKEFRLFESILYNKGYVFLEEHLKRLKNSAEYFGFNFDILKIRQVLKEAEEKLSDKKFYKVKLFLNKKGKVEVEWQILKNLKFKGKNQIILSKTKTDSCNVFLYHKTTNRYLYDSEYRKALNNGFCEVIFTNKKGEITEGAISNIFILKDGIYFTPPVNAGLLDGIYRRYFIKTNRKKVVEKSLFLQDLLKADKIFICNSVRGLFPVTLVLPG